MSTLFRQEVIEKQKNKLAGNVSLALPPNFNFLAILIAIIIFGSLSYLTAGEFARKEKGIGILVPDAGLIRLNAPQSGVITNVEVSEGQIVAKDFRLLNIQSEKYGSQGFQYNEALIKQYQNQITFRKRNLQL